MLLFTRLFLSLQFICGYHAKSTITRYVASASSLVTATRHNRLDPDVNQISTFLRKDPHADLTITALPTGVSVISTWGYPNAGQQEYEWVVLEATDFPNGELPTPTEGLDYRNHPPTFAVVTTYTASLHCPTGWTATATQYISINERDWWAYIPRATSTVRGPVMKTKIYPISPTITVDGPATYVYTTTTATINELPDAATRTPGPMYYLPTDLGFQNLNQDPEFNYMRSWDQYSSPEDYARNCRHPTNMPPGPNYYWSTTDYKWVLPAKHDFAAHRRRKLPKIIIPSVLFGLLLIIGLLESWFWFGRLMTGRKCYRCGTFAWGIATLIGFAFITSQVEWKDAGRREELAARWKQMGVGQKLWLWLKWGFRRKYPVEVLGDIREDPGSAHVLAVVNLEAETRAERERRSSVDTLPVYVDTAPAYSQATPAYAKPEDQVSVHQEEMSTEVDVEQRAGLGQGNGQGNGQGR